MGRGFCQDELEEIFVRAGCEVGGGGGGGVGVWNCMNIKTRTRESKNDHSDKPLRAKTVSAMASTIFESSLHCTISESKEMIFPRRPLYFTGKVLPCCIIVGTKCLFTCRSKPCVQRHFAKRVIYLIFVSCIRWRLILRCRPVGRVGRFCRICVRGQFVI